MQVGYFFNASQAVPELFIADHGDVLNAIVVLD
jgi:hypothetical protein